MGVPKLYSWINSRYPSITYSYEPNERLPLIDNLYIDLNGMIHEKFSNRGSKSKFNYYRQLKKLKHEVNNLLSKLRPFKLIYIAVDGVAPLAKLELQRKRRFTNAKKGALDNLRLNNKINNEDDEETEQSEGIEEEDDDDIITEDDMADNNNNENEPTFSSSWITPGTEFMDKLGQELVDFLIEKIELIKNDTKRKSKPIIIFSGHEVPGEGEHKIVAYMRGLKASPQFDPSEIHGIYSNDADMIMLGLATHIPTTLIIRKQEYIPGVRKRTGFNSLELDVVFLTKLRYCWFNEFGISKECLIDDIVLLLALVGNDFLPHLKGLTVESGGLDKILQAYTAYAEQGNPLPLMQGSIINLPRLQGVLTMLKTSYFRSELSPVSFDVVGSIQSFVEDSGRDSMVMFDKLTSNQFGLIWEYAEYYKLNVKPVIGHDPLDKNWQIILDTNHTQSGVVIIKPKGYVCKINPPTNLSNPLIPKKIKDDHVPFVPPTQSDDLTQAKAYARSLQWVMCYYYQSVPSWLEFYPYTQASVPIPDFLQVKSIDSHFKHNKPLTRYQTLLAMMPPTCSYLLPLPFHQLMTSPDSPLKEFYSMDKPIPIQLDLFLQSYDHCYQQLSSQEKEMDVWGSPLTFNLVGDKFVPQPITLPKDINKFVSKPTPRPVIRAIQSKLTSFPDFRTSITSFSYINKFKIYPTNPLSNLTINQIVKPLLLSKQKLSVGMITPVFTFLTAISTTTHFIYLREQEVQYLELSPEIQSQRINFIKQHSLKLKKCGIELPLTKLILHYPSNLRCNNCNRMKHRLAFVEELSIDGIGKAVGHWWKFNLDRDINDNAGCFFCL